MAESSIELATIRTNPGHNKGLIPVSCRSATEYYLCAYIHIYYYTSHPRVKTHPIARSRSWHDTWDTWADNFMVNIVLADRPSVTMKMALPLLDASAPASNPRVFITNERQGNLDYHDQCRGQNVITAHVNREVVGLGNKDRPYHQGAAAPPPTIVSIKVHHRRQAEPSRPKRQSQGRIFFP
jgi:hypothetical protein